MKLKVILLVSKARFWVVDRDLFARSEKGEKE